MNLRIVRTILAKELLDTMRDKRTVIMMIGVPILLYPAITLIGFQLALLQHQHIEETDSRVAILAQDSGLLREWIGGIERVRLIDSEHPTRDLAEGALDAVVVARGDLTAALEQAKTLPVEIQYDGTELPSRDALMRITQGLEKVFERIQKERLTRANMDPAFITPFTIEKKDAATAHKTTGTLLGGLLPLFMIVMLALGAFYPAVDLTAGEKERGTFETLLASPITKLEIVSGKFLAVFSLAMCTGLLNLLSMGLTFLFIFSQVSETLQQRMGFQLELPLAQTPVILLTMIPLAFFISAAIMALAVLARSFKEAQNYVTPFFIFLTMPLFAAMMPGTRLEGFYLFLPVGNVALLFKELMTEQAGLEALFYVMISNIVFALLALVIAVRLFQREDIVLSQENGLPLTFRRGLIRPADALTPGGGVGLYAFVMLLLFYLAGHLQQRDFISGLVATEWLLILAPVLLMCWYAKVGLRKGLLIVWPAPRAWAGSLLVGLSAFLVVSQLTAWLNLVFPMPEWFEQAFNQLFQEERGATGFAVLLLAAAVSPAICEEALFRGALLTSLRRHMSAPALVLTVGLLFGMFHLNIYRLFPTALLGMLLTWAALRTGSILCTSLIHLLTNGAALWLAAGPKPAALNAWLDTFKEGDQGLPLPLFLGAAVVLAAGMLLINGATPRKREPRPAA